MKARTALLMGLTASLLAANADAGLNPYLRIAGGASQFKMAAVNERIHEDEKSLNDQGFTADFKDIGLANGTNASAGLWLFPAFRIGATYALFNGTRDNRVHEPGALFYDNEINFRMREVGGEAAVRIPRWAGLTLGGTYARGEASAVNGFTVQQPGDDSFTDVTGRGTKNTYGFFLGLDQTNEYGVVGYVRAGYRFSDMGSMTFSGYHSDGFTSTPTSYTTIDMDFSGYYLVFGTGFDLKH